MPIIDIKDQIKTIERGLDAIKTERENPLIQAPFTKDFSLRFCWSSNAIEGNTLDLEETISVIEYDEVRGGHTYTEYQEAKNLYRAIEELLVPFQEKEITESWIKKANGLIRGIDSDYRTSSICVGTLVEAVYYSPSYEEVPALMEQFIRTIRPQASSVRNTLEEIAVQHIKFEQIHPFKDGTGRVGRMVLNQQLINQGLLPLIIEPKGKYRQTLRQYDKNKDSSVMTYILCKGEQESIQKMQSLIKKKDRQIENRKQPDQSPHIYLHLTP